MAAGEEADTLSKLASDENVKHPLQNRWTLWYFKNEKNKNWKEMQHMVSSFATVEDFWAYVSTVKFYFNFRQFLSSVCFVLVLK